MSETESKDIEATEVEAATEDDAVFDEKPAEKDAKKSKSAGTSIAWLALFLALVGVAGVGYLTIEKYREAGSAAASDRAMNSLQQGIDSADEAVTELNDRLAALTSSGTRNDASIAAVRRDLESRADLFDSLPTRMSTLERSVAALQGVSIEARNTYLIAEAEYYLQIGNSQLQLAGNPYLASLALEQADDRLLQLADPALTDTRAAIANELAALEVMEKPDIAGATLVLASLAGVVDSLPLRSATGESDAAAESFDAEASAPSRAWAAVKEAASGLVKVTRPEGDAAALITPDVAELARNNLSLQLQAARLALLRGEQEVFEQSIDDADAWLELYFDTGSAQVESARETMAEVRDGYASVAPPDISQSLRLLRQYKTLAENAQ
jgi:uroporphyrin-3 C-methyltransferase